MQSNLIWDIPTRLFHWLLVGGLLVQYITAEWMDDAMQWHFYSGYFLLGLLIFRLWWGLIGPDYAKFSSFVTGPARVYQYSRQVLSRHHEDHAGHNPLGGWVVLLMLFLVMCQAVSGLFLTDDIFLEGPWRAAVDASTQDFMNFIHHRFFNLLLWLIGLHVAAIAFYSFYKGQKLVPAMFHGKKVTKAKGITSSKLMLAIVLALCSAALTYYIVELAPPKAAVEAYY